VAEGNVHSDRKREEATVLLPRLMNLVRETSERNGASRQFLIDQIGGNTGG